MTIGYYTTFTTFWDDFSVADIFGRSAVQDTFNRAFNEWKSDYKYLTELVMILNWKCWYWTNICSALADLYEELYYKADGYACENLKGDELRYYYQTTD